MKHNYGLKLTAAIFLVATACSSAAGQCSNATIVGTYRYLWTGYGSFGGGAEPPLRPNGPFTPFAAVGLGTFNADGTSSNTDTVQIAGGVLNRNFTNTLQGGGDCRGTVSVQGGAEPPPKSVVGPAGRR